MKVMKKKTIVEILLVNFVILALALVANQIFIQWISHTIYSAGSVGPQTISWVNYTGVLLIIDTTAKGMTATHTFFNYPLLFIIIGIGYNLMAFARLFLSNRFKENDVDKGSGLHLY